MKLLLDTQAKTIKIESAVLLKDMIDVLEKILPNGQWKEFTLECGVTIAYWNAPYIIPKSQPQEVPTNNPYPWTISSTREITNETYCIEA